MSCTGRIWLVLPVVVQCIVEQWSQYLSVYLPSLRRRCWGQCSIQFLFHMFSLLLLLSCSLCTVLFASIGSSPFKGQIWFSDFIFYNLTGHFFPKFYTKIARLYVKVPLGRKFIGLFRPNSVAEYRVLFIFPQKTEQQTFHPNIF